MKCKSHVKREITAEACGKQLPALKAAGQQRSVHLHIRDNYTEQLLHTIAVKYFNYWQVKS